MAAGVAILAKPAAHFTLLLSPPQQSVRPRGVLPLAEDVAEALCPNDHRDACRATFFRCSGRFSLASGSGREVSARIAVFLLESDTPVATRGAPSQTIEATAWGASRESRALLRLPVSRHDMGESPPQAASSLSWASFLEVHHRPPELTGVDLDHFAATAWSWYKAARRASGPKAASRASLPKGIVDIDAGTCLTVQCAARPHASTRGIRILSFSPIVRAGVVMPPAAAPKCVTVELVPAGVGLVSGPFVLPATAAKTCGGDVTVGWAMQEVVRWLHEADPATKENPEWARRVLAATPLLPQRVHAIPTPVQGIIPAPHVGSVDSLASRGATSVFVWLPCDANAAVCHLDVVVRPVRVAVESVAGQPLYRGCVEGKLVEARVDGSSKRRPFPSWAQLATAADTWGQLALRASFFLAKSLPIDEAATVGTRRLCVRAQLVRCLFDTALGTEVHRQTTFSVSAPFVAALKQRLPIVPASCSPTDVASSSQAITILRWSARTDLVVSAAWTPNKSLQTTDTGECLRVVCNALQYDGFTVTVEATCRHPGWPCPPDALEESLAVGCNRIFREISLVDPPVMSARALADDVTMASARCPAAITADAGEPAHSSDTPLPLDALRWLAWRAIESLTLNGERLAAQPHDRGLLTAFSSPGGNGQRLLVAKDNAVTDRGLLLSGLPRPMLPCVRQGSGVLRYTTRRPDLHPPRPQWLPACHLVELHHPQPWLPAKELDGRRRQIQWPPESPLHLDGARRGSFRRIGHIAMVLHPRTEGAKLASLLAEANVTQVPWQQVVTPRALREADVEWDVSCFAQPDISTYVDWSRHGFHLFKWAVPTAVIGAPETFLDVESDEEELRIGTNDATSPMTAPPHPTLHSEFHFGRLLGCSLSRPSSSATFPRWPSRFRLPPFRLLAPLFRM